MGTILERERNLYENVFSSIDNYTDFSPGLSYIDGFLSMIETNVRGSVLDAGCGSGKGAIALLEKGFDVSCCDVTCEGLIEEAQNFPFTEICLWNNVSLETGPKDWVYCCDVMEHIPTAFTMLVVHQLLKVARQGVFFSIALVPDQMGYWVGQALHQTVQPFEWWRDQLSEVGHLKECRDLMMTGLYLLEPIR